MMYRVNQIAAELDSGNNVLSRFVYGSDRMPVQMIRGNTVYAVVTDYLGSLRMVVELNTGTVMQQMEYDEFGRVITDEAVQGFDRVPFGYAGGLYDRDTGVVRFGARDYDAETGRWVSKDPIAFAGGDTHLYGYVANDPVNASDETGAYQDNSPSWDRWASTGLQMSPEEQIGFSVAAVGLAAGGLAATSMGESLVSWYMMGAENDAAWSALSLKDKFFYEVGQKTVSSVEWSGIEGLSAVEKGEILWGLQGPARTLLFIRIGGIARNLPSGPTPLFRYLVPRGGALLAALGIANLFDSCPGGGK